MHADPRPDPRDPVTGRFQVDLRTEAGPLRVRVWPARGPASRRPVIVACPDWLDTGEVYGPQAARLGHRWTVIAPDPPGHGGTPWTPSASYDLDAAADRVAALLDRLPRVAHHRAPVLLLGHGVGGLLAARAAAAHPERSCHLVLEEPAGTTLRRSRSSAGRRQLLRQLAALDPQARRRLAGQLAPHWPVEEQRAWADAKALVDPAHLDVPVAWGEPLAAALADVACPVTLVRGRRERGAEVSMTAARRCAAACRSGCEVVALDAGHSPRREAPEAFGSLLAELLGRFTG